MDTGKFFERLEYLRKNYKTLSQKEKDEYDYMLDFYYDKASDGDYPNEEESEGEETE